MPEQMIMPVYLNQKAVFDMLAIRENGFSKMTSVQRQRETASSAESEIDDSIGSTNAFSFLGVRLGGRPAGGSFDNETEAETEERIHTPTSLFARLLTYLSDDGLIRHIGTTGDLDAVKTGDFISFRLHFFQRKTHRQPVD